MIERVYNNNCNIQGAISKVAFLYLYYSMWHLYLIKYYSVSPRFGDVVLFVIVTTLFSVHVIYGCIHVASLGRIYFKSIAFLFFISILSAFFIGKL